MNPDERDCPKCKGAMEKGTHFNPMDGRWVKGKPKPLTKRAAWKNSNTHISAYRCNKCGFIEQWSE